MTETTEPVISEAVRMQLVVLMDERHRHKRNVNALNYGIQALSRERSQEERACDDIDRQTAAVKLKAGIPHAMWSPRELRMDHEAWREESTIQDPDDTRCSSRGPDKGDQCSLREGHDLRWGHEHWELGQYEDGTEYIVGSSVWADYDPDDPEVQKHFANLKS